MKPMKSAFLALAISSLASAAARADWPTYLHDISRVGATDEKLAAPFVKRWEFSSPVAPKLAWPGEEGRDFEGYHMTNRVRFDEVFHPVVAGGRVYFGSSVDGRVICRDLATGRDEWSFFTGGPVRLAPMFADGRLYVGSDDGHAYCLDAAKGTLVWKLRAGPNDEQILARGRMTSRWPVRTGVLVEGGKAYFGAGVFPHENVFLHAADAATGKVVWRNDSISQADAGRDELSPQGYMLATKDILFVPSARALSVAFDRATGERLDRTSGSWRGIGGTKALLADDQIYAVGEHQILATEQTSGKAGFGWFRGSQMTLAGGMGFFADGKEIVAVDRHAHAESSRERYKLENSSANLGKFLKKHPALAAMKKVTAAEKELTAAKKALGELARAGKAGTAEHAAAGAALAAAEKELAAAGAEYEPLRIQYQQEKDQLAAQQKALAAMKPGGIKWTAALPHESALVVAGGTLIAGGNGEVVCLDTESGRTVAKLAVEGDARGLAVSDGHLLVSTTAGKIYAFADSLRTTLPEVAASTPLVADPFPKDELTQTYADAAEAILRQTGATRGYCLVLGSERGRLALEIAKRSELIVYGLEPDAAKVAAARETLVKTGLYGSRIIIDPLDLGVIPYGSYFANLIVSDTALLTGKVPGSATDAARCLRPLGGVICLGAPEGAPATEIAAWIAATKLGDEKARAENSGRWSRLVRGALPGSDSWSHQYGNASNTSSNEDRRIKGGLGVLWYGDPGPGKMVNRHNGAVGPLSVNGRLFIQGEESVMAYDAYNGTQLWEVKNPGALRTGVYNAREPGNMVATDDALFMLLEEKCIQFDAQTGRIVRTFTVPGWESDKELQWGYIAQENGLLFGTATKRVDKAAEAARRGNSVAISTDAIFAFDVKSGALKWTHQGSHISHVSIALGDGNLFFIDASLTPEQRNEMLKQDKSELAKLTGKAQKLAEERIKKADLRMAVALDAATGRRLWGKPVDVTDCSDVGIGGGALTLMYHNRHLVLGGANANGHYWQQFLAGEFSRRRLVVLDSNSGEKLWAKDANYRHRPLIIGNEIIAEPWSYDLYSGEQKTRTHPLTGEQTPWMFARPGHHCGAISATPNMMFFRSKSTAFYNLEDDQGTQHFSGQRLGCWINMIPANGLVMIPEASAGCVCLFSIAATIVFEPREQRMEWGVYSASGATLPVQHMALNLGAPGDRRDSHGKLWLGYPRPASRSGIDLPLDLKQKFAKGGGFFSTNEASRTVAGTDTPWVFTSGARGLTRAEVPLIGKGQPAATYTVRLYFAAAENDGRRIFDIKLQGNVVAKDFDPAVKAGGANRAFVAEFHEIPVTENLLLELASAADTAAMPVVCGLEVLRTGAGEITAGVATR